MPTNAQNLGNQFGLRCPKCLRGDDLRIAANIWARLCPDGTDNDDSDTEWDSDSKVRCMAGGCDWIGKVSDLKEEVDFDPDGEEGDVFGCTCGVEIPKTDQSAINEHIDTCSGFPADPEEETHAS